jgi:deazaflavin-dependent oxidoreductase (nitroreductase family)
MVLAHILHHVDGFALRLTQGKHSIAEAVGLPIVQVTSLGAKTGRPRTLPLVGVMDGKKIALIGTNFGQKHNPGWYYNLRVHPQCLVHFKGSSGTYTARETEGQERDRYWQLALAFYAGYEQYRLRAAHRKIPVMLLEPVG